MKLLCLTLIMLGLMVSGYLLWRHFMLAGPSAHSGSDFCSALFGTGCDDALRSPLAVQLGLPLAGWGLVYYGTLACLLVLGWSLGDTFQFEATTAALLLALAAALGSVGLFVSMVAGLAPFCPMCAVVHAVNLLLLFPLKRLSRRPASQTVRAVAAAIRYLAGGKASEPVIARWKLVGFLTSGLVAAVIYQWVYVEFVLRTRPTEIPFDPQQTFALFESGLQHEIPVAEVDPHLGPAEAPVRMVVFGDLRCLGCRQLAQVLPGLAREFDGSLQIVFKHFPLDSTCNAAVKKELHPRACEVARAAEAAREQGRFWAFHDAVFAASSDGNISLKALVEHLGLDLDRFEAYRTGDTALAKIQADIDLGVRLGVDGTPSVFVNGRRVYDIRPQTLQFLVAHSLGLAAPKAPASPVTTYDLP
jgi:uncharacterized membrane protein